MNDQLAMLARSRRKKAHAHNFRAGLRRTIFYPDQEPKVDIFCDMPGCKVTEAEYLDRQKLGRTSLRAGKNAERAIAKAYGGTRVGQYGGISDVEVGQVFSVQSKAGGWFSRRYWDELSKLPRTGGRIPTLIVSDRPGSGKPTRRMVIRFMSDDLDLHGPLEEKP